jgi:hypothetical protein
MIGLDQHSLTGFSKSPKRALEWFKVLLARYPHRMLITERALPDFLHVVAPTTVLETSAQVGSIASPWWLPIYMMAGGEYYIIVERLPDDVSSAERAAELAAAGFTPMASWPGPLVQGTRAALRWRDLGEFEVPRFDRGVTLRSSRDR